MMDSEDMALLALATIAQERARKVIADSKVVECWQGIGADVNLIGSLKMGLLMKHRDIDFHIYTKDFSIAESFRAMQQLAQNPNIKRIEYANLLNDEDSCLEWHAWFDAGDGGALWQLDMMHIVKGSRYDGYFEGLAERIGKKMTMEQKVTILRLKNQTPEDMKIPGIEYYMAVLRDSISDFQSFLQWRQDNPQTGIVRWHP